MVVKSYAKINSILYVLGKRPDGYHELFTLMHKIDLFDWISVKKSSYGISVKMNVDVVPLEDNLVFKAAKLFFEQSNIKPQVEIEVEKRIPIGSGLGGGSSNAAVTLLALNELFDFPLEEGELFKLAAKLGSDVPFFLVKGTAIATGRGEKIKKVSCDSTGYKVFIVVPNFGISTRDVYRKFRLTNKKPLNKMALAVKGGFKIGELLPYLHNDLEDVVLKEFSLLRRVKERMVERFGCGLLSGSGSTLFSIIGSEVEQKGEEEFGCMEDGFICKTLNFAE